MTTSAKWVTPEYFSEHTGYTLQEIQDNQEQGYWPEGSVWRYTPDGDQVFSFERYNQWVEGQL